jgi:PAS domain S-box-containing protein
MPRPSLSHRGERLEALLSGDPDAVLAINAEGIIQFANKEACKLTERDMDELIGESIVEVYETLELAKETNRKIYKSGGTIHDHESRVKTRSGKVVPVRISASHLRDSAGKYIGGIGYFARYRPSPLSETEVKARLEQVEGVLDNVRTIAQSGIRNLSKTLGYTSNKKN